jgi:hypothetical protein
MDHPRSAFGAPAPGGAAGGPAEPDPRRPLGTDALRPERGDPTWVPPALTREAQTRHVGKTPLFFGPPLAILTAGQKNTMEISGKVNRTAERYLEIQREHGVELTEPERQCIAHLCGIGWMSPQEIRELPMEVELTRFECDGLDKPALAAKLKAARFADLVAVVEALGF